MACLRAADVSALAHAQDAKLCVTSPLSYLYATYALDTYVVLAHTMHFTLYWTEKLSQFAPLRRSLPENSHKYRCLRGETSNIHSRRYPS